MTDNNRMLTLGWAGYSEGDDAVPEIPETEPARVISHDAGSYTIATADSDYLAEPSGRAAGRHGRPPGGGR